MRVRQKSKEFIYSTGQYWHVEVRRIYQEVYPEPGQYHQELKKEFNEFLNDWLKNMIEVQKYQLAEDLDEWL